METKADIVREICDLVSIPEYSTTSGSSIPRRFFSDLLDTFGIDDEGDSVTASKKLFELTNFNWDTTYASENTPSGGGDGDSTVEIRVAKHRNGPLGTVELFFDKQRASFKNIDTYHENTGFN